ncbi:MAG: glycosyltransferase, partial [Chloroflexi bacterium]|nr:glycosyltransferase [Chloroflexota bacterium]
MSPRRILFLTPQLPYPPEQGTALRNYNLLREVSRQHEVSLLSFQEAGAPLPEALSRVCVEVRTVIAPQRSWRERMGTLLSSPLPDMAHRLWCKAFEEALREMEPARFDLVQVEGIELARYGLAVRAWCGPKGPRIVFDDHNAEYVLQRRAFEADRGQPGRWPAALYSLVQWQRLRRFEREVCRAVDGVVAASEADAQALRALVPGLEPLVVPNGVDVERYHPGLADSVPLDHPAVVFTGKMDFRPNVDAVLWFGREVWPRIVRQRPEARFYVVGKSPHRRL